LITSLLYTSKSTAAAADIPAQVEHILAVARPRNLSLGVTGALFADRGLYAQVLEGSRESVDVLMDYIDRDPRHNGIAIVRDRQISARQFANWSMAHVPPSRALDELLDALALPGEAGEGAAARFVETLRHSASALLRL